MSKRKKIQIKSPGLLVVSIVLSHLAGFIGSFSTVKTVDTWYAILEKPEFSPPNWIFAPVWLTLYTMMGIALYFVWLKIQKPTGLFAWFKYKLNRKKREKIQSAVVFFMIHLVVNALWSIVFFGLKDLGSAFIVISLLWVMILVLIKDFFSIDKRAAYLLVPYLLWVSFATVLNYSIWMLN